MEQYLADSCFCGNNLPFNECCKPYHDGNMIPETPEQLMRSRYSAYVTQNVDYLIATWHPDCHAEDWRKDILNSFKDTKWIALRIISSSYAKNEAQGYVEFSACFIDEKADHKRLIHERSRFLRQEKRWYYIDGITPKTGRNDPCPCGSGKKFKKCCDNS
ncbi:YchJ family protein [Providencia sneebia]|uniref:UPF0225 protein OO7_09912 n=1 Tax=Providencia sneebia DSM 19967 TaxID=1141660 RepID=K8W8N8_9GAMM|nr:YchJ family protein [Providencia sneebia]EKT56246.1 hypothetical protein OO7_09912 [Providencia sneebia DSM 19967]